MAIMATVLSFFNSRSVTVPKEENFSLMDSTVRAAGARINTSKSLEVLAEEEALAEEVAGEGTVAVAVTLAWRWGFSAASVGATTVAEEVAGALVSSVVAAGAAEAAAAARAAQDLGSSFLGAAFSVAAAGAAVVVEVFSDPEVAVFLPARSVLGFVT
jgi:hypothetical protein